MIWERKNITEVKINSIFASLRCLASITLASSPSLAQMPCRSQALELGLLARFVSLLNKIMENQRSQIPFPPAHPPFEISL